MLFNSLEFLVFFPVVTILYFLMPTLRIRNILLLIASYFFYMQYKPEYGLLMLFSTLINYIAALQMDKARDRITDKAGNKAGGKAVDITGQKKLWMAISIVGTLGVLFFFKYFNFFNSSLRGVLAWFDISYQPTALDIILPVGISFYTFQTMSYSIDVYRGDLPAERDFIDLALYVSFFPQLVAGPIERSTNLLHQFKTYHDFDAKRVSSGLRLMVYGFFKKVVIADRLAVIVDTVYNNPSGYDGVYYIIATVAFAIQIYCDFSGYSDIARGSARIMGFELMHNFDRPYFSKSVTEFWRRWHISLSSWFRDYLYFPLGGSRKGYFRPLLNLFIIFLASGLWHGASWTFVIWGALNGVAIVIEKILGIGKRAGKPGYIEQRRQERRNQSVFVRFFKAFLGIIPTVLTFVFTCFTWVFFRARSVGEAFYMLPRFLQGFDTFDLGKRLGTRTILGLDYWEFFTAIGVVILLFMIEALQGVKSPAKALDRMPTPMRLVVYSLSLSLVIWLAWTETQTFIYFAF